MANVALQKDSADSFDGFMNLSLNIIDFFDATILFERNSYGNVIIDKPKVEIRSSFLGLLMGFTTGEVGHDFTCSVNNIDRAIEYAKSLFQKDGYSVPQNFDALLLADFANQTSPKKDKVESNVTDKFDANLERKNFQDYVLKNNINFISDDDQFTVGREFLRKNGFVPSGTGWAKPKQIGNKKIIIRK
jgi:hypothetical protein